MPRALAPRAPRPRPPALELGALPKHPSAPMPKQRPAAPRPTQAPRFPPEPPWPARNPALIQRTSTGVLTATRPRPLPPGPVDPEDLRDPEVARTRRGRTANPSGMRISGSRRVRTLPRSSGVVRHCTARHEMVAARGNPQRVTGTSVSFTHRTANG